VPPERNDSDAEIRPRPFWSGTITFGLVSIPVDLYPANRSERVALRMLSADGTPLSRQYYCPRNDKVVAYEDLVRGYEIEKDKFVPVTDKELESLEPQKSREIDLRRFVPVEDIDPLYFRRGYFFAPTEAASKAYRLLAETMEESGRAGIATFVMRGKEYLVAILASDGLLRAETLRFRDEIRSPDELALPEKTRPDTAVRRAIERGIKKHTAKKLSTKELEDRQSKRIRSLAERKWRRRNDVVTAPDELVEAESGAEVIDLMQALKERMSAPEKAGKPRAAESGQRRASRTGKREVTKKRAAAKSASTRAGGKPPRTQKLTGLGKDELYARAQKLDIPGRSGMNKEQLRRAVERASRRAA
jgi:DNA end-binding protein Ku